jgi:hypothetical protein
MSAISAEAIPPTTLTQSGGAFFRPVVHGRSGLSLRRCDGDRVPLARDGKAHRIVGNGSGLTLSGFVRA